MESLFLTLLIDTKEDRDVATADVVGAYLLTDMYDDTVVKVVGNSAKIMCKVNNKYENYITTEKGKGKPVLYLKLKRHCMDVL